nr:hypothetical protein [Agrobacterium radiobacter]
MMNKRDWRVSLTAFSGTCWEAIARLIRRAAGGGGGGWRGAPGGGCSAGGRECRFPASRSPDDTSPLTRRKFEIN